MNFINDKKKCHKNVKFQIILKDDNIQHNEII